MRKIHISFLLVISILFAFSSCKKNEPFNQTKYVNDWIYEQMSTYYFWNTKIPTAPDYTFASDKFFGSLLYKYNKATAPDGDRFSWIDKDYKNLLAGLSGVSSAEIGFDYIGVRTPIQDQFYLLVTYPKKGTDAYTKGLKRGDFVVKINGLDITASNANELIGGTGTRVLGIANWVYNPGTNEKELKYTKDITVMMHSNFAENPIYLDTVYSINGKNIGYLVYHFFARDKGDGSHSYDKDLMSKMQQFQSRGVSEMVLDFRYNSGGAVSTAIGLASALVKDRTSNKIFGIAEYNSVLQSELKKYFKNDKFNIDYFVDKMMDSTAVVAAVPALNLQRVYVLTGKYTASASELIINGLKPHMDDVVLVGDTTYGKNVGSISLYEEKDPKNTWGLQPIVVKYYNAANKSDYTAGFNPNFAIDELEELDLVDFGDTSDPLLRKALTEIAGPLPASAVKRYNRIIGATPERQPFQLDVKKKLLPLIDDKRERVIRQIEKVNN